FYQSKGRHIITLKTEHQSVLGPCEALRLQGFEVTYLSVGQNGLVDLAELAAAIRDDTILVSVMMVNDETGVIQYIPAIAKLVKSKKVLLHVDAIQAAGKIPIDV